MLNIKKALTNTFNFFSAGTKAIKKCLTFPPSSSKIEKAKNALIELAQNGNYTESAMKKHLRTIENVPNVYTNNIVPAVNALSTPEEIPTQTPLLFHYIVLNTAERWSPLAEQAFTAYNTLLTAYKPRSSHVDLKDYYGFVDFMNAPKIRDEDNEGTTMANFKENMAVMSRKPC